MVRDDAQRERALGLGAARVFLDGEADLAAQITASAPDGVHRIAEVDLAAHADLDAEVLAIGGAVCS